MEITILSAEGLENKLSILSGGLRPFATLTLPPNGEKPHHEYKTRVGEKGGTNAIWGDKFNLPINAAALYQTCFPYLYLQILTKNRIGSCTQLGWCHIPVVDIDDGLSPAGTIRHLSYRLRGKDGSRGKGVVKIAVKLGGGLVIPRMCPQRQVLMNTNVAKMVFGQTVVGIPVTVMLPPPDKGIYIIRS